MSAVTSHAALAREPSSRLRRLSNLVLIQSVYRYLAGTKSTGGAAGEGPNAVSLLEAVKAALNDDADPLAALPLSDMPNPAMTKPSTSLYFAIGRGDLLLLKTIVEGTKVLSRAPESAANAGIHVSRAYWATKDPVLHSKIVEVVEGFARRAAEIRVVPPDPLPAAAPAATATATAAPAGTLAAVVARAATAAAVSSTAAVAAAAGAGDTGSSASSPPVTRVTAAAPAARPSAAPQPAARPRATNNTTATVDELCAFARAGRQADCERLLEAGVALEGRSTTSGLTALAEAVIAGEDGLTRYLVDEKRANVRVRIPVGGAGSSNSDSQPLIMTVLSDTSRDGSELVRFLLSRGAADDFTPEDWAAAHSAAVHPVMGYWLKLAQDLTPPTPAEQLDLASVGLQRLHGLMFSCVGQFAAKKTLIAAVKRWRYFQESSSRPLVLLLAGPPGHGKSVMGKALAAALGIEIGKGEGGKAPDERGGYCSVDLGQLGTAEALLGYESKYRGGDGGTKLGNFLHKNSGKPVVVQLDELDKVEIRHADMFSLMYPLFEEGRFHYKSKGVDVDVSKAIFVLTSNWGSDLCVQYAKAHPDVVKCSTPADVLRLMTELEEKLRDVMLTELRKVGKDALVSRIDLVVPFVPFSDEETRLIAEEALQELLRRVARPPRGLGVPGATTSGFVVGNLSLSYDGVVADFLADRYRIAEGARSLRRAIEKHIQGPLAALYNSNNLPSGCAARLVLTGPRKHPSTHVQLLLEGNNEGGAGAASSHSPSPSPSPGATTLASSAGSPPRALSPSPLSSAATTGGPTASSSS